MAQTMRSADERLPRPRFQIDRPVERHPARRRSAARSWPQRPGPVPGAGDRLGSVDIPLDVEGTGWWLTGLFGAPTTTGTGPYTHVWQSGADTIPSYTLEIGHPKLATPVFFGKRRRARKPQLRNGARGAGQCQDCRRRAGRESAGTTVEATPSRYTLQRFSQGRGSIKKGGTQLAGVTAGNLTFSNTLERVRTIRPDGKITPPIRPSPPAPDR